MLLHIVFCFLLVGDWFSLYGLLLRLAGAAADPRRRPLRPKGHVCLYHDRSLYSNKKGCRVASPFVCTGR